MAKWGVWCKPKRGHLGGRRPGWFRFGYGTLLTFDTVTQARSYVKNRRRETRGMWSGWIYSARPVPHGTRKQTEHAP